MTDNRVATAFESIENWCQKRDYKGYDPYDALNSFIPFGKMGKWPGLIAIQVLKRLPVNVRPLLGIGKKLNPKAAGLFLHGYSLMFELSGSDYYARQARHLFDILLQSPTPGYDGLGWGYPFKWTSSVKSLPAYSPTSVATGFIARGVAEYHRVFEDTRAEKALLEMARFIDSHIPRKETENGLVLSYSTVSQDCCINASLLAAEVLALGNRLGGERRWAQMAEDALSFAINTQEEDGRWTYSIDLESGKQRDQIDFHQGYVIESIYNIQKSLKLTSPNIDSAIAKGLNFYRNELISEHGRAYFRHPRKWPTDIHHQAEAIIAFSRFHEKNPGLSSRAVEWAIENMQQKNGAFGYRRYRSFTDKTAYMRWGQAWMFLALATYLHTFKESSLRTHTFEQELHQ